MIQQQTILRVADNSGAKTAKCIKVLGGFKKKTAFVANTLIVAIQRLRNKAKIYSKVQKGQIYRAVVIRTKYKIKKKDGSHVFCNDNCIILLNKQNNTVATRVLGPISKKLKSSRYQKITNISVGTI